MTSTVCDRCFHVACCDQIYGPGGYISVLFLAAGNLYRSRSSLLQIPEEKNNNSQLNQSVLYYIDTITRTSPNKSSSHTASYTAMAETFRDTAVGAVIRYFSGNRYLQFPEERAGFTIPELWQKMLDGDVEVLDENGEVIQPMADTEKPVEQRSMFDVSPDGDDTAIGSSDEENIRHIDSEKPNIPAGDDVDDINADNSPYAALRRAPTAHSHIGSAAHQVASVQHTRSREETLPYTQDRLNVDELHDAQRTRSTPIVPRLVRTRTGATGATGATSAGGKAAEPEFETAIVVDWYTADDRSNPLNWSISRRFVVALIIWIYTFVVYMSSAIYTNSQEGVMETFGVSATASSLGLSMFVLGYGVGPLLFSPLSEIPSIGRNPVYAVTMVFFVIFSLPTALAYGNLAGGYSSGSFGGLLVLRFLQGFFGSPCLASGAASLGDIFSMLNLPYGLVAWVSAGFSAPALGPLLSGYSVPAKGWRWSLLEILWAAAPVAVIMLAFLPETSTPNILLRRAKRLRKLTGSNRFQAPSEVAAYNEKMAQQANGEVVKSKAVAIVIDALIKPLEITIKDPAVLFVQLYTAIIYGIYYSFFEAFPLVYPVSYGMSAGEVGLVFLCILVAATIGIVVYCTYVALVLNRGIRKTGQFPPNEDRLIPAMYAAFGPTIGLFIFAWTANGAPRIPWIAPTIGITLYGATVFVVLQCVFVYIPLSYPQYAASLFAANDFFRSAFAAGSILFGRPLFINLGIGRGVSVLGGLSTIGIVGIWLLYFYGARLRAMSKFAV